MRWVGICAAALFGVGLLAYAVGLGIYAFASTRPVVWTQPRSEEEARRVIQLLDLSEQYPFLNRFLLTPHGRMHFVDEGQGTKRTILCLHGNGSWSLDCAALIKQHADGVRVIAPDLIGFGLSEKPHVIPHRPVASHAADLSVLVELLELRDVELLAADSSAPIAIELARLEPERVRSTVMHTAPGSGRALESLVRTPVLGEVLVQGLGALSPGFARGPYGRLQGNWDERASTLALARAEAN
ncbi:MAG TPA: alpha/beta fold hydrolase [Myxococcota bacterium]|nr:alpha/beta fold hydrolase [Myxococcota bacterium]